MAQEWRRHGQAEFLAAPVRKRHCRLWPTVRRVLRRHHFDLMHSHGMIAAAHAAFANWRGALPHVVSVHDVIRPQLVAGPVGRAKLWLLDRLLDDAKMVIAVSNDVRANLLHYLPRLASRPQDVTTVMYGIDTLRFSEEAPAPDSSLRRRLGLDDQTILIGFLGRYMEQKGFLPLLDALHALVTRGCPVPFHLVAVGSGDCERRYRSAVEQKGLGAVVSFLDFVPDVAPILRQLDLVAIPSLWEAAPLLALEALCAGVPIVGSDCIGLREVLYGTPSRVLPAGNVEAWAEGLRQAIHAPHRDAARAYAPLARRRFNLAPAVRRLETVYDAVLTRCSARSRASAA